GGLAAEALERNATTLFHQVVDLSPCLPDELAGVVQNVMGAGAIADAIAASLPSLKTQLKQELLETESVKARLGRLVAALTKEVEVLELGSKIQSQVESEVGKGQREYYLREQLKAIQKELGESDERGQESADLRAKIEAAGMPGDAKKEALWETGRSSEKEPRRCGRGTRSPRCPRRPPSTRWRARISSGSSRCRGTSRPRTISTSPRRGRSSTPTTGACPR